MFNLQKLNVRSENIKTGPSLYHAVSAHNSASTWTSKLQTLLVIYHKVHNV